MKQKQKANHGTRPRLVSKAIRNACRRSPCSRDRDREIKLDKVSSGVSRLRNSTEGGGEEAKRVLVAQEPVPGNLRSGVGGSGRGGGRSEVSPH